jgi:hypothetical protein
MQQKSNSGFSGILGITTIVLIAFLSADLAIADDIIAKLGEPRRNVVGRARSADEVSHQLARTYSAVTGVIPLMIFPSNSLVVEAAFKAIESPTTCRSILSAYDRRLRAEHGDKIRHGLYCVSISDGKLKSIDTIAKSF